MLQRFPNLARRAHQHRDRVGTAREGLALPELWHERAFAHPTALATPHRRKCDGTGSSLPGRPTRLEVVRRQFRGWATQPAGWLQLRFFASTCAAAIRNSFVIPVFCLLAWGHYGQGGVARLYATIRRVSALRRRVSGVGERVAGAGSARSDAPYGAGLGALGARRGKPQPVPRKTKLISPSEVASRVLLSDFTPRCSQLGQNAALLFRAGFLRQTTAFLCKFPKLLRVFHR